MIGQMLHAGHRTWGLGVIPIREEETSFAPTAEFALFVAGGLLTLLVVGFVIGLLFVIRREEREAAAARAGESSGESSEESS